MDWEQFGQGIMSDPFVHLGLGILAGGEGAYGSFGQQLGQGAMAGIVSANRAMQWQQQRRAQEIAREQQRQQQQARQQWAQTLPTQYQQLVNAGFGNQVAQRILAAPPKPTGAWQNYQMAQQQGFPGTFLDYQRLLARAGSTQINMPTQTETAAAGKLLRIQQAADEISALEKTGGDVMSAWDHFVTNYTPSEVQGILRTDLGNRIATGQNQWIQTFGRDESGAAIPETEWPTWRRDYFPQIGDDPYTIAMKRRARKAVEQGMSLKAGRAAAMAEAKKEGLQIPTGTETTRTGQQKLQDITGFSDADASGWKTLPDGTRYRIKP